MTSTKSSLARDKILDAAEKLVLQQGALSLTLDAVAKSAKVSKGGLLYHFPSKDALIRGLVQRIHTQWAISLQAAAEKEKPGKGHMARILYRDAFDPVYPLDSPEWKRHQRLVAAIAAAVAHNPDLVTCCRENYQNFFRSFEKDSLPMGHSLIMMCVYDAMWWSAVFGTYTLTEKQRNELSKALSQLLEIKKPKKS